VIVSLLTNAPRRSISSRFDLSSLTLLAQEAVMASEIGVLVVHGIGVQKPNFAAAFIAEMTSRLERLSVDRDVVEWRSAFVNRE
jgi:hypothetical protein